MSSDNIAHEIIALDKTWHKIVSLVCKEGHVSISQVRRFIYLVRDCTKRIEDLETYVNNHLSADDITDDIDDVVAAFEAVDHFIETHLTLSEEDLSLYQDLKGDMEDHLLRLLYTREEANIEDEVILVFYIL